MEQQPRLASHWPPEATSRGFNNGVSGGSRDILNNTSNTFSQQPVISLPKGGGALRGIDDKFSANPVTGAGSMSIPIGTSPGRSGFGPNVSISYNSGSGNGPFGLGWSLPLPSFSRRTDKGIPKYNDEEDTFILSDTEDLVPSLASGDIHSIEEVERDGYTVRRYRPRVEGQFARIERWTSNSDVNDVYWRTITPDNTTTLYGIDQNSRISDPGDAFRIFQWLIRASYDKSGNVITFEYKTEDSSNVLTSQAHEQNRTDVSRSANRYIKRIRYGNRVPGRARPSHDDDPANWMFEVVFDYGEHDLESPKPDDDNLWKCRQDPFSSYRAAFDIRTYRLCQRVLMFHRFPDALGEPVTLVRSTRFVYDESPGISFLSSVVQYGHVRRDPGSDYLTKAMPPVDFEYTKPPTAEQLSDIPVRAVESSSLENLPFGVDDAKHSWLDLNGEGLPSAVTEIADGWFYKRNTSAINLLKDPSKPYGKRVDARFMPLELLSAKPNAPPLESGNAFFMDVDGDGLSDLVCWDNSMHGFYRREYDERSPRKNTNEVAWSPFQPYESIPNIDPKDPSFRFVDVTGDGLADLLQVQDNLLTWYPSLASRGFGPSGIEVPSGIHAPRVSFANANQDVYLVDMSGDGLADLVHVANGTVSYWPNLGYGRFGAKVSMDNAPIFDVEEAFDPQRIRLADIDGSGVADMLYLTPVGVNVYRNNSGNSWTTAQHLPLFPHVINDLTAVNIIDLLGIGTSCLVWSSTLPGDTRQSVLYLDLMDGQKPHLLTKIINNLGRESEIWYAPSTYFSLSDMAAGKPWITRLPFPMHCVERVISYDRVSRTRFVSRFAYHHGCYDIREREFRGFAFIEQWDTEDYSPTDDNDGDPEDPVNLDQASFVPPVHTKRWFHTGVDVGVSELSRELAGEFYGAPSRDDPAFDDYVKTVLPASNLRLPDARLTALELREACRALKGSILREEIFSNDAGPLDDPTLQARALIPYSVSERSYSVELIQSQGANQHAVFFSQPRESLTQHLERNPSDGRVTHALILEVDRYGNVLRSCTVSYGRQAGQSPLAPEDAAIQQQMHVTYSETDYTNMIDALDDYRLPAACEVRSYELTGFSPSSVRFVMSDFTVNDFKPLKDAARVPYEHRENTGDAQLRLLKRSRTLFRSDNMLQLLPLGHIESLALPGQNYSLVFTPGILSTVFKRKNPDGSMTDLIPNPAGLLGGPEGGYVDLDSDGHWWGPGGRIYYHTDPAAAPADELALAKSSFFLPRRYTDIFGNSGIVEFDNNLLLTNATVDALNNRNQSVNDYRVLQPRLVTDPNGNRGEVAFDVFGAVVGTAVMGKPEEHVGDSLVDFKADLTQDEIDQFYADPRGLMANKLLANATSRVVYDGDRYWREPDLQNKKPAYSASILRETHSTAPLPSSTSTIRLQVSFSYSTGSGHTIQRKGQAEPGPLGPSGPILTPRWHSTGWTIQNNKGRTVRAYEPFFDSTHHFTFNARVGVSPITFYDALGRVVGSLAPNHAFSKVTFTPWAQTAYDTNDTVTTSNPCMDPDLGAHFQRLRDTREFLPSWYDVRIGGGLGPDEAAAARKAAVHSGTPGMIHLDALGRPFLSMVDNGSHGKYMTRMELDVQGNVRSVVDAVGRVVQRNDVNMALQGVYKANMDGGERWTVGNAVGGVLRAWNGRGMEFRCVYDALQRPVESWVLEEGREVLLQKTVYGESSGVEVDPGIKNMRTRVVKTYDQAGIVENHGYDFKGNLIGCSRRLAVEYKTALNWTGNVELEAESFSFTQSFDAINRVVEQVAPDNSILRPTFNDAAILDGVIVNVRGETQADGRLKWTRFVSGVELDARGLRTKVSYGNGTTTSATHDPVTARLVRIQTTKNGSPDALQDLNYTYDTVGNITTCRDQAQQTIFFRNQRVEPSNEYIYDAIYRLIEARGREHLGQASTGRPNAPSAPAIFDPSRTRLTHPGDRNAMGTYVQMFRYDAVGNILAMRHVGSDPAHSGWTRTYNYNEGSPLELTKFSNRLSSTTVGGATETYRYDGDRAGLHGLPTALPQLSLLQWDHLDQLRSSARQIVTAPNIMPETTYYVHGTGGQRARKVTERQGSLLGPGLAPTRLKERIYLGIFEIYREFAGDGARVTLERETLHVMDDSTRVALIESRTRGTDPTSPARLVRYQYSNPLGSTALELDDTARVVSYQEYFPYGATAYQAVSSITQVPKRFQFCGKEREEETGLDYSGARYYASWIGRFISADPGGLVDGPNLYRYAQCNPIVVADPSGFQSAGKQPMVNLEIIERHKFTGLESQEEIKALYAKKGIFYDGAATFEGEVGVQGSWFIDRSQVTKDSRGKKSGKKSGKGAGAAPAPAPDPGPPPSAEPPPHAASPPVPSSDPAPGASSGPGDGSGGTGEKGSAPPSAGRPSVTESFAAGFAEGFLTGLVGGLAIGGLIAAGGVFAVIGVGFMLAGAFMTGQTIGELLFGNTTSNRKAELIGGLTGGLLGGLAAGGILGGLRSSGGGEGKGVPVLEETAPGGRGSPPVELAAPEPPLSEPLPSPPAATAPPSTAPSDATLRIQVVEALEAIVAESAANVRAAQASGDTGYFDSIGLRGGQAQQAAAGTPMGTGNAVQAAAAQKIAADPLLSKHVDVLIGERGPDGRLLSTPDFRLKFPEGDFFGDITTSSARAAKAHFKSYGDTLLLFPY